MKTIYLILIFCLGLWAGYLLFPSEKKVISPTYVEHQRLERKLRMIDTTILYGEAQMHLRNNALRKQLVAINSLLSSSKAKVVEQRRQVRLLTQQLYQKDSVSADSLMQAQTVLNAATDAIMTQQEQKDSVMERLVAIRDTQLVVCDQAYQELKSLVHDQQLREQQLTEELNKALKNGRRKRWQNRILAAGMLFASGITATLYFKR